MQRPKVELTLNQPIYVGLAFLNLSKTLMYDFHHKYIKENYPYSTLLLASTYYFKYQIQTDNMCEDFYTDNHLFHCCEYEKESPFYNDENKKNWQNEVRFEQIN